MLAVNARIDEDWSERTRKEMQLGRPFLTEKGKQA
jgi:hypothetical protein